jgi:hypothetical protein
MRLSRYTTCTIALTAALSMPVFAQDTPSSPGTTGSTSTSASPDSTTRRDNDRGFNWGWLGLLGLAGLMGFRKQPEAALRMDATRPSMPR